MTTLPTKRRGTIAWMFFDWAAQPFHTLIITFIFAPYFTSFVAGTPAEGQQLWGYATGLAGLVIAVTAPVLGAVADQAGPRKPWIALFSIPLVTGSALLWWAAPGDSGAIPMVLVAFAIGLIGLEFATVFNNAMMPGLVSREDLGKLSGSGWALGYIGGIIALLIVLGLMSASPETGKTLFGLTPILGFDAIGHQGDRAAGPLTAIWYVIFVLPLFLFTPDVPRITGARPDFRLALAKLGTTIKTLPRRRSYFAFLLSSMAYRDGLNSLYAFGGIYAAGVLGMSVTQIGVFGILAAFTGTLGAWIGGRLDARFGPKAVAFWSCWLLVLAAFVVVSTTPGAILFVVPVTMEGLPVIVFYIAGGLIGAAAASLQSSSRTLLVDQVEPHEQTEAFGLFALTGRAISFVGPISIALVTGLTGSQQIGVMPLVVLLALGAIGLTWVKERGAGPSL
jgi:UMF1 family MFS transporter